MRAATPLIVLLISTLVATSGCGSNTQQPAQAEKPVFHYVSANWSSQVFNIGMSDIWQSDGIEAKGQNYFFVAQPAQGRTYSERFDPLSSYFQAWFGTYTVDDQDDVSYGISTEGLDVQAVFRLSIADQRAWLSELGVSEPTVAPDTSVETSVDQVDIGGHSGWKITGRLYSNIDVGANNPQSEYPPLLVVPPAAWQGTVASYSMAQLDVVSYVWHAAHELVIVYYNGVSFDDLAGAHHETLPDIVAELDEMATAVTVGE